MWTGGGLEDSGSNPPTYSSGEGYGFKKRQTAKGKNISNSGGDDAYDFEVEGGSDVDSADLDASDDAGAGAYKPSLKDSRKAAPASSLSTARGSASAGAAGDSYKSKTAGSMATSKGGAPKGKVESDEDEVEDEDGDGDRKDSWKSSWNELMKGVHSPISDADKSASLSEASPPAARGGGGGGGGRYMQNSPLSGGKGRSDVDSSREDSMEISASDFQVGVDAARRAKEKTTQRQRRQAMDEAPHITRQKQQQQQQQTGVGVNANAPKVVASPDVKQRNTGNRGGGGGGGGGGAAGGSSAPNFKIGISAALSSIQRSDDSGAPFRFGGSVEKSDGDLYHMLGGGASAAASAEGAKMGGRYYDMSHESGSSSRHVSDFSSDKERNKNAGGNRGAAGSDSGGSGGDDDDDDDDGSGDSELAQSSEMPSRSRPAVAAPVPSSGAGKTNSGKTAASPVASDYDTDDFEDAAPSKDYAAIRAAEEAAKNMERIRARWLNPGADLVSSLSASIDTNVKASFPNATAPGTVVATAVSVPASQPAPSSGRISPDERDRDDDDDGSQLSNDGDAPRGADNPDDSEQMERDRSREQAPDNSDLQYADADPAKLRLEPEVVKVPARLLTAVGSASMVTSVPPPAPPLMSESAEMIFTSAHDSVDHRSRATVLTYSDSDRSHDKSLESSSAAPSGANRHSAGGGVARYPDQDDSTSPQPSMHQSHGDASQLVDVKSVAQRGASAAAPAPVSAITSASATTAAATAAAATAARSQRILESFAPPPAQPVVIAHTLGQGDDRDSLKVGADVGVNAFGQRAVASRGQAMLNTIVAVEIDPAVLGIDVSSSVASLTRPPAGRSQSAQNAKNTANVRNSRDGSDAAIPSRSSVTRGTPNPPTQWPSDLPMSGSSTGALHAKLALLESAESKRIAAVKAQAQKMRELRSASGKGGSQTAGKAQTKASKGAGGAPGSKGAAAAAGTGAGASSMVNPAVSRLEQGTARLARQFERMERELKNVRESASGGAAAIEGLSKGGSVMGATPARDPLRTKGDSPSSIPVPHRMRDRDQNQAQAQAHLVDAYPSSEFGARASASRASGASATLGGHSHSHSNTSVDPDQGARLGLSGASKASAGRVMHSDDGSSVWETEALTTMKRIVAEGDKIQEKERALAVREEALRVREAVMEMDYRNPNKMASMGHASSAARGGGLQSADPADAAEAGRVKTLEKEIERLKSRLFEAASANEAETPAENVANGGDTAANTSLPLPTHANKSKQARAAVASQDKGNAVKAAEEEGTVTISKAKYNALQAEIASLETLVEGYQRENEKLVAQMKDSQSKQQSHKARYFDERENLNKDLNRLRNQAGESIDEQVGQGQGQGQGGSHMRRSADMLREDLNKDAAIFALKERLGEAESRMGHREKELQKTIERLRLDNQQLSRESTAANSKAMHGHLGALKVKDAEVVALTDQNAGLRSKLEWYAENQVLIENADKERRELGLQLAALKKELRRKGVERSAVQALCNLALDVPSSSARSTPSKGDDSEGEEGDVRDASMSAGTKAGGAAGHRRALADIKKIKDLEDTVQELQESLRKRNPDSVNNLVRAAAMSEEMQAERRVSDAEVDAARRELTEAKADFDLRLRSLRQEHEKIKAQYEKRIEALEAVAASSSTPVKGAASAGSSRGSTPGSGDKEKGASPKTLAGALVRVRELESEVERVRAFYTKKVDDEKRKAEAQISALKRGTASPDGRTGDALSYGVDGVSAAAPQPTGQDAPATATGKPEVSVADQIQNALAELRADYDVRLSLANAQVSAAQKEAQEARVQQATSGYAPAHAHAHVALPTAADIRTSAAFSEEVAREVSARLAAAPLASSAAMHANELQHAVRLAEQKGNMEAEALRMRVREEEHRTQLLQREVDMLRAQAGNASAGASSAAPQFAAAQTLQALETQITHLELRLARREGELMSALEQGRSASKIERARLEAIHASELREKDEQLVKFQTELEQLVYALRQWQAVAYEAQQQAGGLPPPPRVPAFGLSM